MKGAIMKTTYRQQMAQKTKRRIYRAAIKLISKRGFDNVSVSDIVEAAQVSRGSFYFHFKNKDDIISETLTDMNDSYLSIYSKLCATPEMQESDALQQLECFLIAISHAYSQLGAEVMRLYYAYMFRNPEIQRRKDFHYAAIIRDLLSQAREQQLLTSLYTNEEILDLALMLNRGIATEWALHDNAYPIESKDNLITRFCQTLRKDAPCPAQEG